MPMMVGQEHQCVAKRNYLRYLDEEASAQVVHLLFACRTQSFSVVFLSLLT